MQMKKVTNIKPYISERLRKEIRERDENIVNIVGRRKMTAQVINAGYRRKHGKKEKTSKQARKSIRLCKQLYRFCTREMENSY